MKYVWSIAYFVNGNNLFSFGKKKKKKKTKQNHEFLPDILSFTIWFLSFGNRIVKTYDLISIADFAG